MDEGQKEFIPDHGRLSAISENVSAIFDLAKHGFV
jgi:hypothetical protein